MHHARAVHALAFSARLGLGIGLGLGLGLGLGFGLWFGLGLGLGLGLGSGLGLASPNPNPNLPRQIPAPALGGIGAGHLPMAPCPTDEHGTDPALWPPQARRLG